ncbi:MAG: hypothetical protein A2X64_04360 [Ignavibacteria bacterium GWF2_33_9]|nr:MAG: hypothetical protein A2X64_04360 [Ignavibacteria bacterium GWF2_33_9]
MEYSEILDAIEALPLDEQDEISHLIQMQIIERKRNTLAIEIHDANQEYSAGTIKPQSVDDILIDILK